MTCHGAWHGGYETIGRFLRNSHRRFVSRFSQIDKFKFTFIGLNRRKILPTLRSLCAILLEKHLKNANLPNVEAGHCAGTDDQFSSLRVVLDEVPCSHGVFSSPLSGTLVVLVRVCLVQPGDLRHQGVVRVRVTE